jgi:hypothetical protein
MDNQTGCWKIGDPLRALRDGDCALPLHCVCVLYQWDCPRTKQVVWLTMRVLSSCIAIVNRILTISQIQGPLYFTKFVKRLITTTTPHAVQTPPVERVGPFPARALITLVVGLGGG